MTGEVISIPYGTIIRWRGNRSCFPRTDFNSIWYDYKRGILSATWPPSTISIPYGTIIRQKVPAHSSVKRISIPYGTIISKAGPYTAIGMYTNFNSIWYDYKRPARQATGRPSRISIPYGTIISNNCFVAGNEEIKNFNSIWYDYKSSNLQWLRWFESISIPYGTIISIRELYSQLFNLSFQFHMVRL